MKEIKLYGFAACGDCPPAKEFLIKHNIPFNFVDIKEKDENMKEFLTVRRAVPEYKGKYGVPAFLIGNEMIVGLDAERVLKAYGEFNRQ